MQIFGKYSFNHGEEYIHEIYPHLLHEIELVISRVDAESCKKKESKEKTMVGKILYSPTHLNHSFKDSFKGVGGWKNHRQPCDYSSNYYVNNYQTPPIRTAYRDMDFVKEGLGVEVQFGKYAFMVYNVCAKMTIFKNLGAIKAGVEIVPMKELAREMSTGVSYFEQFAWDLDMRGVSNIDIPVLILGIGK